jgi:DNA-binding HxlR family transcriptional regulator
VFCPTKNYEMPKQFRSSSPVSNFLDLLGDKWSLLVVRDLFLYRETFSQLIQEGEERISTNILTDRLKKLKKYGIIDFVNDRNDHKVKHYYLTDKGIDLNAVLFEMSMWSKKHLDREFDVIAKDFFKQTKDVPRELVISSVSTKYKEHKEKLLDYHLNPHTFKVSF